MDDTLPMRAATLAAPPCVPPDCTRLRLSLDTLERQVLVLFRDRKAIGDWPLPLIEAHLRAMLAQVAIAIEESTCPR